MLVTTDLMGNVRDKRQTAIDRLRMFEPPDGYYLAFSGGKDSQAIYHLALEAGVKFDAHYTVTSVDPPELVRFIKKQYPEVSFDIPQGKDGKPITMWNLIPKKTMPPTRVVRYCCAELKEANGKGRITITGVRWSESINRSRNQGVVRMDGKKAEHTAMNNGAAIKTNGKGGFVMNMDDDASRRTVEQCYRTSKTLVNPIVDWDEEDVWEYLNHVVKAPHCELYDQGYKRLGCVGCPMSYNRARELERYPKIKGMYLRAFERMLEERRKKGMPTDWQNAEDVMKWYLGG